MAFVNKNILEYISAYKAAKTEVEKKMITEKIRSFLPEQFEYLLQYGSKHDWWEQSEILVALGYPCVKPVISKLFEWLQDMNWPGTYEIKYELLLKIDKAELISGFSAALCKAFKKGDSDWLYWLSLFADDAHFTRNDFSEPYNAYDMLLFYATMYEDGELVDNYMGNYLELLRTWGYPRIEQFIYWILVVLGRETPHSVVWNQHMEVLNMIPDDIRDEKIREGMRKLFEFYKIETIGSLKEILPIGDTDEDYRNYILSDE